MLLYDLPLWEQAVIFAGIITVALVAWQLIGKKGK
jgi:hypothetical protein